MTAVIAAVILLASAMPMRGQFEDASKNSGLDAKLTSGSPEKAYILESMAGGVGFLDYDRDGWPDIYLVNGGTIDSLPEGAAGVSDRLYRNNRDGTFSDVTRQAGLGSTSWGMGVAVADADNNGYDDLYVTNYGPNRLYLNRGDGRFEEASGAAGAAGDEWSSSAGFADYDGDGDADLYVANYLVFDPTDLPEDSQLCRYRGIRVQCGPRGMIPVADRLYENAGDGTFRDASAESGIAAVADSYGLGVTWCDLDNDSDSDLYVANDSTANFLFQNEGDGSFVEVGLLAGAALSGDGKEQAGMGADCGDFDNDGLLDLVVTNFSEDYNTVYRNEGGGVFRDISYAAGLGEATWPKLSWGVRFVDFDRDGLLDLSIADGHVYPEVDSHDLGIRYRQPNSAFLNLGGGKFAPQDLAGADAAAESSRGLATADFDNDGAVDLLVANLDGPPTLLRGTPAGGGWLLVQLTGTVSNRSAIGARVTVQTGETTQIREVRSGGSYQSQSDFRLHFGLGDSVRADSIKVRWPSGKQVDIGSVEANQVLRIEEPAE